MVETATGMKWRHRGSGGLERETMIQIWGDLCIQCMIYNVRVLWSFLLRKDMIKSQIEYKKICTRHRHCEVVIEGTQRIKVNVAIPKKQ